MSGIEHPGDDREELSGDASDVTAWEKFGAVAGGAATVSAVAAALTVAGEAALPLGLSAAAGAGVITALAALFGRYWNHKRTAVDVGFGPGIDLDIQIHDLTEDLSPKLKQEAAEAIKEIRVREHLDDSEG